MMISRRQGLAAGIGALATARVAHAHAESVTVVVTQMPWRGSDAARIAAEIGNAIGAARHAPVVALLPPAYGAVDERVPAEIAHGLGVHLGGVMNGQGFLFAPNGQRLLRGDGIAQTSFARVGMAHARDLDGAELLLRPSFDAHTGSYNTTSCIAATAPDALDLGEVAADLSSSARVIDWTGACLRASGRTLVTAVDLAALRRAAGL